MCHVLQIRKANRIFDLAQRKTALCQMLGNLIRMVLRVTVWGVYPTRGFVVAKKRTSSEVLIPPVGYRKVQV